MIVINLFGGPGSGKSTTAAGLFYLLKIDGINVELATEYAKDLTWEKRFSTLENQAYVFGKQLQRLERVKKQVDFIINDSPIILSTIYEPVDYPKTFRPFVLDIFNSFTNINVYIDRANVAYQENGRNQKYEEALEVDKKIKSFLDANQIKYLHMVADKYSPSVIKEYLKSNGHIQ